MSANERKQIWLRVEPDLHARLQAAAGSAPLSAFCESLLEKAMSGQTELFREQRAEGRGQPAAVTVDISALLDGRLSGLERLAEEILRQLYQTDEYLHAVARNPRHETKVIEARRGAQRRLWKLLGFGTPNNGGGP